ncbi:MAG: hypothetical protein AAFR21_14940 [Pseudomonadota bacterium]
MITSEDIEAFAVYNREALDAADEFVRRSEKGIPSDRWADGESGLQLVAQGIHAQQALLNVVSDTLRMMIEEQKRKKHESTELCPVDV